MSTYMVSYSVLKSYACTTCIRCWITTIIIVLIIVSILFDKEGDVPDIAIKFGTESIVIDSWTRKKQYDAFCAVLGSGVYQHLQVNFSALLIKGLTQH